MISGKPISLGDLRGLLRGLVTGFSRAGQTGTPAFCASRARGGLVAQQFEQLRRAGRRK